MSPARPKPGARARRLVVALGLVALLLGGSVAVRDERETAQAATAAAATTSGSLSLSNSRDGSAILKAAGMKPGGSTTGTVTIKNTGTVSGSFALSQSNLVDTPGPHAGLLSRRLDLLVEDVTGGGTQAAVYAGKLGGMPKRPLGTFGAGESRTYRFKASFPKGGIPASPSVGDNAYQASSTNFQFHWTATAADTDAPRLWLRGAARQRVLRRRSLILMARSDERSTLTVTGRLSVVRFPKARFRSRRLVRAVPARRWTRLKVTLPRRALAAAKRGLSGRRPVRATLRVGATDLAGNRTARTFRITLKR